MKNRNQNRKKIVPQASLLFVFLLLFGCSGLQTAPTMSQDSLVQKNMDNLGKEIQSEDWEKIKSHFDPDYYGGRGELRTSIENYWEKSDIVSYEFSVDRVLESDDTLSAQVRWHIVALDINGNPVRKSGLNEFIFRRADKKGKNLQLLDIKGDFIF